MMLHYVFIAWPNHYSLVFILKGMCGTCTNSRTWNQCRESTCRIITKSAANGTMCLIRDVPVRFRVYSVAGGGGPRGDGRRFPRTHCGSTEPRRLASPARVPGTRPAPRAPRRAGDAHAGAAAPPGPAAGPGPGVGRPGRGVGGRPPGPGSTTRYPDAGTRAGRGLVSGRPLATAAGVPQPRTCSDPGTPTGPLGTW